MKLHWFQHVPFEGLGTIETWAAEHGHTVACTRLFAGDPVPGLNGFEMLVVMGGPMGVYDDDEYPWLVTEKEILRAAIDDGKTVLGICLGAQLIADVLGAVVTRGEHREIGWLPISRSPAAAAAPIAAALPESIEAFHWHGDMFTPPPGAVPLFASEGCPNQAFLARDRVLALQFHLETTPASARALIEHCGDELTDGPYIQPAEEILGRPERFARINRVMAAVLDYLSTTIETE